MTDHLPAIARWTRPLYAAGLAVGFAIAGFDLVIRPEVLTGAYPGGLNVILSRVTVAWCLAMAIACARVPFTPESRHGAATLFLAGIAGRMSYLPVAESSSAFASDAIQRWVLILGAAWVLAQLHRESAEITKRGYFFACVSPFMALFPDQVGYLFVGIILFDVAVLSRTWVASGFCFVSLVCLVLPDAVYWQLVYHPLIWLLSAALARGSRKE